MISSALKRSPLPFLYLLAIVCGVISGLSDIAFLQNAGVLISDLFIKAFKCISLPIIALSLIVTLATCNASSGMQKIWQRTVLYTFTTTIVAAALSCVLYLLIGPSTISTPLKQISSSSTISAPEIHYLKHLSDLIPSNIFSPFLEHQVIGVLLVGLTVGLALRLMPLESPRQILTSFFQGIHGLFLVMTHWIVKIIPLGLYGFITTAVLQFRDGIDLKGIGGYLTVVVLANILQGFVVLPAWLKMNALKPFQTMQGMLPALSVAFFSKSSTGTLPLTINAAEKNLHINPTISRFVLPLCTSINMNGCAAFIFTTVIYLMQNHGVEISWSTLIVWIGIATIAAIGNAGVPMGCFFLSTSLLASMNIPLALLALILPFYSIIDMLETALNVWSDACVATVVNKKMH